MPNTLKQLLRQQFTPKSVFPLLHRFDNFPLTSFLLLSGSIFQAFELYL